MTEEGDTLDTAVFPTNNERAAHQLDLDIRVIIANPPYSKGQTSANDDNANLKYPTLDGRIETTYVARSTATLKNSLYDSYIRAVRWASDRIKDAGIIGFVTNGGFIDGNTADGVRKTLADEFATIYVFNLRGNQRTAGEQSRREGGKIFGTGSRNTVAITFLVKKPGHTGPATIHYRDIGDYLSREQKLEIIAKADLATLDWGTITPNAAGDWINQRGELFDTYAPIAAKGDPTAIFRVYSGGLKTNRDAWVYNYSPAALKTSLDSMVTFFNSQVDAFTKHGAGAASDFVDRDPTRFSWDRADFPRIERGVRYTADPTGFRAAIYRPFQRSHVYFDRLLNNTVYQLPQLFPMPSHANFGIYQVGAGSAVPFSILAIDAIPDVHLTGAGSGGQVFARWTYEPVEDGPDGQGAFDLTIGGADVVDGFRKVDNISPVALADYRKTYGHDVTSDEVFFYVYGLLHSPEYRTQFAADLKKSLPRIPKVDGRHDFDAFVEAGRRLADLHIGYQTVEPYPLTISGDQPSGPGSADPYEWFRVDKMRFAGTGTKKDRSSIVYNSHITVADIPDEAHEYLLGSRSGVEWVIERYRVHTDRASGIVNDPNAWSREVGNPRYVLDLLARVVTVSVETVRIVKSLPTLDLA